MENHEVPRHPGPWRVMRVDSEFAGLLVAVGFLVMGLVSMPLATAFVLGAIGLGVVVALLFRLTPKKLRRGAVGMLIVLAAFTLWWIGHKPLRPHGVSSNALYVLPDNVPGLHKAGYWLECWFDQHESVDRCRLTDEHGAVSFEDVFLQCEGCTPVPQSELVFRWKTGRTWIQSCDKKVDVPIVYVAYEQTLLPRSLYRKSREDLHCD